MAVLTLSQIEAQVRALLSDAGAGSLEFTPQQMARAIDFAQVQIAKQLGMTYFELPIEVVDRKVAIPLDAISVIRVETTEFSPRLYGPTLFSGFTGPEPGYAGGELDFSHDFAGDFVEVDVYVNPIFGLAALAFKPKIAMSPSDGAFSVVLRIADGYPEDPIDVTHVLASDSEWVDARIDQDVIYVYPPAPPFTFIPRNVIITLSVIRPWISMSESLEAVFNVQFG